MRLFLRLRNRLLRRADGFVAISSEIQNELTAHGIDGELVHPIPNSVDTSRFAPVEPARKAELRHRLDLPGDAAIVTYTGRLVTYKGLPLLLRVWRDLCRQHARAVLVLVGPGGLDMHNCEAELKEFLDLNDLGGRVRFTGSVDNVHEYLQASDLFVFSD